MTDEPQALTALDRPHAPVIYFEDVPTVAFREGLISVTLCMDLHLPMQQSQTQIEKTVAAYLKTNIAGARALRDLLDKVILAATPPESSAKN